MEEILGAGLKLTVPVRLEQLKIVARGKDGGKKLVSVSRGHRDKRFGENFSLILI